MNKFFKIMMITMVACVFALADDVGAGNIRSTQGVPEIDAGTTSSAVALLSGALLVLRARRRS